MKTYKEELYVKKEKVLSVIKCDHCNKDIFNDDSLDVIYYEVFAGHHDWGGDSIDSQFNRDFCSTECLSHHMKKYFDKANGSEYYEIERRRQRALKQRR